MMPKCKRLSARHIGGAKSEGRCAKKTVLPSVERRMTDFLKIKTGNLLTLPHQESAKQPHQNTPKL
jgi:hypothetical protein